MLRNGNRLAKDLYPSSKSKELNLIPWVGERSGKPFVLLCWLIFCLRTLASAAPKSQLLPLDSDGSIRLDRANTCFCGAQCIRFPLSHCLAVSLLRFLSFSLRQQQTDKRYKPYSRSIERYAHITGLKGIVLQSLRCVPFARGRRLKTTIKCPKEKRETKTASDTNPSCQMDRQTNKRVENLCCLPLYLSLDLRSSDTLRQVAARLSLESFP